MNLSYVSLIQIINKFYLQHFFFLNFLFPTSVSFSALPLGSFKKENLLNKLSEIFTKTLYKIYSSTFLAVFAEASKNPAN